MWFYSSWSSVVRPHQLLLGVLRCRQQLRFRRFAQTCSLCLPTIVWLSFPIETVMQSCISWRWTEIIKTALLRVRLLKIIRHGRQMANTWHILVVPQVGLCTGAQPHTYLYWIRIPDKKSQLQSGKAIVG